MDAMIQRLAQELERPAHQVENVVHLIDEGNTIPFIARYRKELHGSMDDSSCGSWPSAFSTCGIWRPGRRRCAPPLKARAS